MKAYAWVIVVLLFVLNFASCAASSMLLEAARSQNLQRIEALERRVDGLEGGVRLEGL